MSMPVSSSNDQGKSTPIEDRALSTDDAIKFIGEDDEPEVKDKDKNKTPDKTKEEQDEDEPVIEDKNKDKDKDKKDKKKEGDEDLSPEDELRAIEEELEEVEPDEDQLEALAPPRRQEILKEFPELFKKFPYMEKAYYREQQFSKYCANPEDARLAVEAAETLGKFEEDIIVKGNTTNILKLIKDNNPDMYLNVVDNYMKVLQDFDTNSYNHVLGNVFKHAIAEMFQAGKDSSDEEMQKAAVELNKFLFGSTKYTPPKKLAKEDVSPDKKELQKKEDPLASQILNNTIDDVNERVEKMIKINIEANIDPGKNMSDYTRKAAVRDATEKINSLIERDSRFKKITDKLWEAAVKSKFSKESVNKIVKAFEAKSRTLLAPVVKSARNEALKGQPRRKANDENNDEQPETKRVRATGENEQRRSSSKKEAIPVGMSTLDFLNQD